MRYYISFLAKLKKGQTFGIATKDGVIAFECKGIIKNTEIDYKISKCVFVDEASNLSEKELLNMIQRIEENQSQDEGGE